MHSRIFTVWRNEMPLAQRQPKASAESLLRLDFIDKSRWSERQLIEIACFRELNYKIGLRRKILCLPALPEILPASLDRGVRCNTHYFGLLPSLGNWKY